MGNENTTQLLEFEQHYFPLFNSRPVLKSLECNLLNILCSLQSARQKCYFHTLILSTLNPPPGQLYICNIK